MSSLVDRDLKKVCHLIDGFLEPKLMLCKNLIVDNKELEFQLLAFFLPSIHWPL